MSMRRDAIRRARTSRRGTEAGDHAGLRRDPRGAQDLAAAGEAADRAAEPRRKSGDAAVDQAASTTTLIQVERAFLNPKGLPKRPWFRHMLIAPGLTTGYAPWPFPALQQAIEERDAAMFATESKRVVAAIRAGADRLRSLSAGVNKTGQ